MTDKMMKEAIIEGIVLAFAKMDIEAAIKDGVADAFPYPSKIGQAIYSGAEVALAPEY